jgi:hypothetical protein
VKNQLIGFSTLARFWAASAPDQLGDPGAVPALEKQHPARTQQHQVGGQLAKRPPTQSKGFEVKSPQICMMNRNRQRTSEGHSGTASYFLQDGQGSTRVLVNSAAPDPWLLPLNMYDGA